MQQLLFNAFCSVDGCYCGVERKGLCKKHYRKASRYGDPLAPCGGKDPISVTHPHLVDELVDKRDAMLTKGSAKKVKWHCPNGCIYLSPVFNRSRGTGCNLCNCVTVLKVGVNDLATRFPELAKEALFDPTTVMAGTRKVLDWRCSKCRYVWRASGSKRTDGVRATGCPACAKCVVYPGVNDLATVRPDLAAELVDQTLATKITSNSSRKSLLWKCSKCLGVYKCRLSNRASGTGCSVCYPGGGFRRTFKCAWLYLLQRDGQQKIGITGFLKRRIGEHKKNGWSCIDIKAVKAAAAPDIEKQMLFVLDSVGIPRGSSAFREGFDGYSESWQIVDFWAQSIDSFYERLYTDVWDKVFSV